MNPAALPLSALLALVFAAGVVSGGLLLHFLYPRPRATCACQLEVVSASRDDEGWLLLDANGEVLPWPPDWPTEDLELFLFARRWTRVDGPLGKEVWLKP